MREKARVRMYATSCMPPKMPSGALSNVQYHIYHKLKLTKSGYINGVMKFTKETLQAGNQWKAYQMMIITPVIVQV